MSLIKLWALKISTPISGVSTCRIDSFPSNHRPLNWFKGKWVLQKSQVLWVFQLRWILPHVCTHWTNGNPLMTFLNETLMRAKVKYVIPTWWGVFPTTCRKRSSHVGIDHQNHSGGTPLGTKIHHWAEVQSLKFGTSRCRRLQIE